MFPRKDAGESAGDATWRVVAAEIHLLSSSGVETVATRTGDGTWTMTAGPVVRAHSMIMFRLPCSAVDKLCVCVCVCVCVRVCYRLPPMLDVKVRTWRALVPVVCALLIHDVSFRA